MKEETQDQPNTSSLLRFTIGRRTFNINYFRLRKMVFTSYIGSMRIYETFKTKDGQGIIPDRNQFLKFINEDKAVKHLIQATIIEMEEEQERETMIHECLVGLGKMIGVTKICKENPQLFQNLEFIEDTLDAEQEKKERMDKSEGEEDEK